MEATKDKPVGAKAGWRLRTSTQCFENAICVLRDDEIELNGGKTIRYAYLERAEAVVVVPVTADGDLVLVRQYRYPVDEWCLEVPAGGTHDKSGEQLEDVARKELHEEIGATAEALTHVGIFYSASAFTDEKCHVYLAEGVELSKEPKTEESETIESQLVRCDEALKLARTGRMKTAPCALALLMCEPLLREKGYVRNDR